MLHDFRRRAAAVHVENVGADFLGHLGRQGHAFRLATEDLDGERPFVFVKTHLAFRLGIVSRETFDRDEFRD